MRVGLPTNVDEMRQCLGKLLPEESVQKGKTFQPGPNDYFIATYPKSGTTWTQQIVHGLRTNGSMDFGEITEVVPWLEACACVGQDMNAKQVAEPRAFKSHLSWNEIPKGGRYIYVVRNPEDVLFSFYRFFEGFMFEPGTIDLETFALEFFVSGSKSGRYWEHIQSWWQVRDREDVLLLSFESLKEDLARAIDKIAAFLKLKPNDALLEMVCYQSSYAFMSENSHHFDDHFLINKRRSFCELPEDVVTSKVAKTQMKKELSASLRAKLDQLWAEEVEAKLGFSNYGALRQTIDRLR